MNLLRDLRYGCRLLGRNRLFAIAAVTVIALGVGATTAVFTVVRTVLLRPLPYADPDGLVALRADSGRGLRQAMLTSQEFVALRDRTDIFQSLATLVGVNANLTGVDDMEVLPAASVTENLFGVLGVSPLLGRPLSLRDDMGKDHVTGVAISYELWQRRWRGDPALVGRQIEVNNYLATVVAVMPKGLEISLGPGVAVPRHIDVFFPSDDPRGDTPTIPSRPAVGRLKPGVSLAAAQSAVNVLAADFVASHAADYKTGAVRLTIVRLRDDVVRDVKSALVALAGAVAFVLLVACANLTNLLLARATARTREIGIRIAIGASRAHVMRQLVTESLLLACFGGAAGLVLASWAVRVLMGLAPDDLPHRELVGIDAGVVLFSIAVTFGSCLLFGLVPAWHASRWDVNRAMKEDPASRSALTRGVLVASQLALALILLVGAGLLGRTFISLRRAPLGYDATRVVTARIQLTFNRFRERDARLTFFDRVAAAVRALPGVEAVGFGMPGPLDGLTTYRRIAVDGEAPEIATYQPTILPGYLEAMGIRMRDGRDFFVGEKTTRDRTPIIVDDGLARLLVPDGRAVGRRVLLSPHGESEQWAEIVGVVDHVRSQDVRSDGLPQLYVSFDHRPLFNTTLVVRTSNPRSIASVLKPLVERLGPGRPVHSVGPLQDIVDAQQADTRFALLVLSVFAGLALLLTAIGVYGVVAYATSRRTREIAVRLALGADARTIVALVLREGALWTAVGLAAGVVGARALTQSLTALLVQVTPGDPLTFAAVVTLVAATAIVATIIPALRAVRVDPMLALRAE